MKGRIVKALLLSLLLATGVALAAPPPQAEDGEVYTVQKDDWLSKIADRYYGDMFAYPRIVEATNAKAEEDDSYAVIENPDLIEVGQKLWIPIPIPSEATADSEPDAEAPAESEVVLEPEFTDFDPTNFDRSTDIDNDWLPLQPGAQWIYEGSTTEDDESIPHRIEFTVTDLTKEIAGVRTVVAWVVDYSDDQLVEAELAFYAQDNDGNVWYLGEFPAEYEDDELVEAPTWIAGLEDARAGIKMKAEPQLGAPSYFQGWGPAVEWTDYGFVDQVGQQTCVIVDCYEDVLVIAESSLEETDAYQLKYYARGVGNVRVGWRGADATQEELELVELAQLSPAALAEVRSEALALEELAYEVSQVYGQTPPAEGP